MGYWFKLKTSTIPTDLGKYAHGVANHIAFSVYNDGVAPIYVNKKQSVVKVALLDASYNVLEITPITIASNLQPFYWKDGTTTTVTGTYTFTSAHFSAQYLALGVFTKQGLTNPDVKLGNMERCFTSNWVILNPDVGAPKPNTRC